ncbi:MAG: glycosyl hydrolase family 2 [Dysgonamonadaceae bacterium]|jgi:hypothetical protein|nr:glycosyl hydrolase family 2 [Dysgonamonadaceae bacterium]
MKRSGLFLIIVILFFPAGIPVFPQVFLPEITQEAKPWTRWWWLGSDVDSTNLTYNLEALSRAGIGGVEITPVYGVKGRENHSIDYLSPEWMRMLAFTESEAGRLGMRVDMNNGTGWPFGGPEISLEDAASRAIFQEYELKSGERLKEPLTVKDKKQQGIASLDKLMAYAASGEKWDLTANVTGEGILEWTAGKDCKLIALFIGKTLQRVKRAAPGGQGYVVDHLNKEAVQRYLSKFDRAFAASRTPFPNAFFNDSYEVYGADWTPGLLAEFEQRRNYRLQDYFPELLAGGATDSSARVVADYRETVGDIIREHFTQVWSDWAHAHQTINRNQAHGSPGNLLDLYASVDIPECESFGITDFDIPGLRKDSIRKQNDSDPAILKYASSAAHITGKKYTSSETFTWLTEHFRTSLSQCKPEVDLMFASGVNHVFFHGTTYSPQDAAWPGWKFYASIDMSPTNSIWKDAPAFFDYITRVQSFLQSGRPDNDFLLYFPVYDIWHEERGNYYTVFSVHDMRDRLPEFGKAVEKIRTCGFDSDYISDRFLQTCTVENGRLKTEGGSLYKALILPSVKRIPLETLSRIYELAQEGATVIFAGNYPSDVPGLFRLEERRKTFAALTTRLRSEPAVIEIPDFTPLQSLFSPYKESFITGFAGQMIRRKHDEGHLYFFSMLQNNPVNHWVGLGTPAASAVFFDPMTGKHGKARLRNNNGVTEVFMQLQPGESIILKTFTDKNVQAENWLYYQPTGNKWTLDTGWTLRFSESDPLVNTQFQLPEPVSWTELGNDTLKINRGTGLYETTFEFNKKRGKEYRLSLGDVRESAVVKVNGNKLGVLFVVPFEINIGEWLQSGKNTIEIEVTNLPANRIADYDRRGVEWRIFHEINFVDITYSNTRYDVWEPLPSGLLGPVIIRELNTK